ncbi:hypothetical protein COS61_02025 [Candidatus Wolfebacteria bacterium CG03_land_8_20_14_0_80_40_12]|uniref:DHHA1 domain-containing protein n=1 Tax=Candidatus Wolfebacteria bacterium CG03_land_8_20_14_0_80_40_12 TaxID=1975069 RepID=A0A2M7B5C5_9BACT|nr:MAG: hypothetical protein COS61_02025 [Candidatus Wolfebacteria bacterium CG03_land_8_20_14_0_80_40_12]
MPKKIAVLYHNDLDGFGAAWAAWKKFGGEANYFPVDYGKPASKGLKNKDIYMLDFCFPRKELKSLLKNNKKLIIIDHHISRKEDIKISTDFIWDVNHSSCVLSWNYFHSGKKTPKLLKYVESIDLWNLKMPFTREITIILKTKPNDFNLWDKIAVGLQNKRFFFNFLKEGKIMTNLIDKAVKEIVLTSEEVIFEKKKAAAVNSPIFCSEIGHYLIKKSKRPIAIIWSANSGNIRVHLRSAKKTDVSLLAKKFGGGGHRAAAGFYLKTNQKFPWKTIK